MPHVSERDARNLAEASRETAWTRPSFLRELFLGRLRPDLLPAYPAPPARPAFVEFYEQFARWLADDVDPAGIDEDRDYPPPVLEALRSMGAFGMLVPQEYGGLGFNKLEWCRTMELLGSYDQNLLGLLSPHQSVGVPETIKQFGTEAQKNEYLPRCARGEISAFALTEPDVGSDPARMATCATRTPDGDFILNGTKLWCTNGTLAGLLIVMARHDDTGQISCFIVETDWPGVEITLRCHFMGLRALANGVITFRDVRVPKECVVPPEGKGLKTALTVLNVGRLSVPAGAVGTAKRCLEWAREWGNARVQWGKSIGRHEANAHKIARMAARVFAMEAICDLSAEMAVQGGYDIRLEAAATKEWNTSRCWEIIDDTFQMRGGRGYETERSQAARGERPMGIERMMRDARVTRIFEGASEVMHLLIAREAVDKHLQVAGKLVDGEASLREKCAALPKSAAFYAAWYPGRWIGWGRWPRYADYGTLATHMRFIDRASRKLARATFHGMVVHGAKLERKQAFLFRLVDIAMELYAMSAAIVRARAEAVRHPDNSRAIIEMADMACRIGRREAGRHFHGLWRNDDDRLVRTADRILDGEHRWLEEGILFETGDARWEALARASDSAENPATLSR